jgi:hypothetical protein
MSRTLRLGRALWVSASVAAGVVLGQLLSPPAPASSPATAASASADELSQVRDQLRAMQGELQFLRATSRGPAPELAPSSPSDPVHDVREETRELDLEEAHADAVAAANEQFEGDTHDPHAREREAIVRSAFELPEAAGLRLAELECRAHSCRLVLAGDASAERSASLRKLMWTQPVFDGEVFAYVEDGRLVVHSARPGTKLRVRGS